MRHWRIWLYLVVMIGILGLCIFVSMPTGIIPQSIPTQVKVASQIDLPTEIPVPVSEVTVDPTVEEVEAPTEVPMEVPMETEVAEVDSCLACHTDKDQLIQNASMEEEVPEESEGAG